MREIKFRAFLKSNKLIYDVLTVDIIDSKVLIENKEKQLKGYVKYSEIELMQYTGLNDKNGKEIYEGDIIEIDENTTTDWEKHRFKIVNIQGAFCITTNKTQGVSRFLNNSICDDVMTLFELWWHNTEDTGDNDLTFVEVIGNVHENPELLEEQ